MPGGGANVGTISTPRLPKNPHPRGVHHRRFTGEQLVKNRFFVDIDCANLPQGCRVFVFNEENILCKRLSIKRHLKKLRVDLSYLPSGRYRIVQFYEDSSGRLKVISFRVVYKKHEPQFVMWVRAFFKYVFSTTFAIPAAIDFISYLRNDKTIIYTLPARLMTGVTNLIGKLLYKIYSFLPKSLPFLGIKRLIKKILPYAIIPILWGTSFGGVTILYNVPRDSEMWVVWHHAYDDYADTTYYPSIEPHITSEGGKYMEVGIGTETVPTDTLEISIRTRDGRTQQAFNVLPRGPPGFSSGDFVPIVVPSEDHPTTPAYSIPLKIYDPNCIFSLTADSLEAFLWAYDGGIQIGDTAMDRVEEITSIEEGLMRGNYGALVLNTSETGVDFGDIDSAKIFIRSLRNPEYGKIITLYSPEILPGDPYDPEWLGNSTYIWSYYIRGPPFITELGPPPDTLEPLSSIREPKNQSRYIMNIYPNPSNGVVNIRLEKMIEKPNNYSIVKPLFRDENVRIYDVHGNLINILPIGYNGSIIWDARDMKGKKLPNGTYFIIGNGLEKKVIIER